MTYQGRIEDQGNVARIIEDLHTREKTGALGISRGESPSEKIVIEIVGGQVSHVISESRPPNLRLGQLLFAAGLVDEATLNEALYANTEGGRLVGTLLSELGHVSERDIGKMLHLQFTEDVLYAMSWTEGKYIFQARSVQARTCPPPFLPTKELVELFRRDADEYRRAQEVVRNNLMRFKRTRRRRGKVPGIEDADWEVFEHVGSKNTVADIVAKSRRSTFEVCLSLYRLHSARLVAETDGASGDGGGQTSHVSTIVFLATALLLVLGIVAFVALSVMVGNKTDDDPLGGYESPRATLTRAQLRRLGNGLDVFRAQTGRYPGRLDELVEANIVSESDLMYPDYETHYLYRTDAESYILVRPKR